MRQLLIIMLVSFTLLMGVGIAMGQHDMDDMSQACAVQCLASDLLEHQISPSIVSMVFILAVCVVVASVIVIPVRQLIAVTPHVRPDDNIRQLLTVMKRE